MYQHSPTPPPLPLSLRIFGPDVFEGSSIITYPHSAANTPDNALPPPGPTLRPTIPLPLDTTEAPCILHGLLTRKAAPAAQSILWDIRTSPYSAEAPSRPTHYGYLAGRAPQHISIPPFLLEPAASPPQKYIVIRVNEGCHIHSNIFTVYPNTNNSAAYVTIVDVLMGVSRAGTARRRCACDSVGAAASDGERLLFSNGSSLRRSPYVGRGAGMGTARWMWAGLSADALEAGVWMLHLA
ncbi:hypothetical protein DFP72DRAFT_1075657 [Ephemerocybe angulata]|uniref:Uncharacterized protein n=1 Tax=Ephemerocybe angulata TaxID=980116 RepID=A0A8H6HHL9_9AGAR|nr:hypothetical protein DFP72DRAFT_1075657 [Tulosesus angulatus]